MKINSESILNLDANKTYYIANSTGEIKEAGLWQRFKCFFGVGDGRAKVQRLAEEVKAALLRDGGVESENKLNEEIGRLDLTTSISGEKLKEIATRFRADHADGVAKADAARLAEAKVEAFIQDYGPGSKTFRIHPDPVNVKYMKQLAMMAAKCALAGVDANTDRKKLSLAISKKLAAFGVMLDTAINIRNLCCEKTHDYTKPDGTAGKSVLALPVLDKLGFKVFASALFKPDGSMKNSSDIFLALYSFSGSLLTGSVKNAVLNAEVPADLVKVCNDGFMECFNSSAAKLSDVHMAVLEDLRDEMSARYGKAINEKTHISSFGERSWMGRALKDVVERATAEGRLVGETEMKDALRDLFRHGAAKIAVADYAAKYAAAHNMPKPDHSFGFNVEKLHPGVIEDIMAATTPDEAQAAMKRHEDKIAPLLETMQAVKTEQDGLREAAIDRIAAETGMDREYVATNLMTTRLENKAEDLGEDICAGTHPGCKEKDFSIKGAFGKLLDGFVKVRVDLLKEIENEKSLNAACKEAYKRIALMSDKPDAHHTGPIVGIVTSGTVTAKNFKDALKAGDDKAVADSFVNLGAVLNAKMIELYGGEKWDSIGPDERDIGYEMLLDKLFTEDEELAALFQEKRAKIEPWLGSAGSPLHEDPVATKLLHIVYTAILPPPEEA